MTTIWKQALEGVANGARFSISFENKSLKLNGKYLIKDGKYQGELGCTPYCGNVLEHIEHLYCRYLYSVPSERSETQRRNYFRALPESELKDEDMMYGIHREEARVELELFILCQLLHGVFDWKEIAHDKWFYQSPNYPSLILLKKWFE